MKFVLDSSVAFKWLVAEPDSDKALRLRDDYQHAVHELLAPDVFPTEVTHSLTRAERQGRVTRVRGAQLFVDLMNTLPQLHGSLSLLPRAYAISSMARIGVYDCLYVALAEQQNCDLITADNRLIRTCQSHFPFIKALASFP